MSTRHYLDHAASSPLVPAAAAAMERWGGVPGNPSSLHASGRAARRAVEESRERLAAVLGCHPTEIVFTSGGTEADNIALTGSWRARRTTRATVVTSQVEHPAVSEAAAALATEGAVVVAVGVDEDGVIDSTGLVAGLDDGDCAVASLQWVNNETGVIQDVTAFAAAARTAGAWSHSDAVQAMGHLPIDFAASGLDLMSVSAHKIGGPVGIGALLVRREIEPVPLGHGGGQERKLRSGTVPVALIAGFAAAAEAAAARQATEQQRLRLLAERLCHGVARVDPQIRHNGAEAAHGRSPAIVNLTFPGTRADDLLLLLDAAGIDCSTGSACTAGVSQPSEVLLAMGRSAAEASGSLRFSFGADTSTADIDAVLAELPQALDRARVARGR